MTGPQISVAIPTRGRPDVLARTLERLERESAAGARFETIVVSNADDPDPHATAAAVDAASVRGLDARHLVIARAGASAGRNAGWRAASAPLVLFLGDDMLARPGLVAIHVETHRRHSQLGDAVLGHVRWSPELRVTPFMRWLDRGIHFDWETIPASGVAGWWHFYTANASVKRELLERVGGFDEIDFPFLYEDIDLAQRMDAEAGLRPHYRPEAVVEHLHETTVEDWRERLRDTAVAEWRFLARNPDARPYFYELFSAAMAAPRAKGWGARLAPLIGRGVPWFGPRVWASVDAYYAQLLAPDFLRAWSAADAERSQPGASEETPSSGSAGAPSAGPK
jgi:GT2 family glycosyltransferase